MIQEKQFNSQKEKANFLYPKQFPCAICGYMTLRENGDGFYNYKYRCNNKKCHRNKNCLYGAMRTIIDDEFEKIVDTTSGERISSMVGLDNSIKFFK